MAPYLLAWSDYPASSGRQNGTIPSGLCGWYLRKPRPPTLPLRTQDTPVLPYCMWLRVNVSRALPRP